MEEPTPPAAADSGSVNPADTCHGCARPTLPQPRSSAVPPPSRQRSSGTPASLVFARSCFCAQLSLLPLLPLCSFHPSSARFSSLFIFRFLLFSNPLSRSGEALPPRLHADFPQMTLLFFFPFFL